jgi:PncC family amidohydrolase
MPQMKDSISISQTIGELLVRKELTISVAESCTGGLICAAITDIPGSSRYFMGGVIAYSNEVKIKLLGVKKDTLDRYGAVSKQVAIEMAEGVKRIQTTDIGLGITGIAGPGGGSLEKPVGLVYMALSAKEQTIWNRFVFTGKRNEIRDKSVNTMLKILLEYLQKRS